MAVAAQAAASLTFRGENRFWRLMGFPPVGMLNPGVYYAAAASQVQSMGLGLASHQFCREGPLRSC
jgi:hypothetical protein